MVHFELYRTSFVPKCFNSSERCSFWQIFCINLIIFTTIQSEESIYDCIVANFAMGFWISRTGSSQHWAKISNSESCKHTCRSFWKYCIALVYQRVFLPDITTYRQRRNWTSWTYRVCRGIKTCLTNVIILL